VTVKKEINSDSKN